MRRSEDSVGGHHSTGLEKYSTKEPRYLDDIQQQLLIYPSDKCARAMRVCVRACVLLKTIGNKK